MRSGRATRPSNCRRRCSPRSARVSSPYQADAEGGRAHDDGIVDSVMVSRESLVTIATNRYSVPVRWIGQALTTRLHAERIALYQGAELVASHRRHRGRGARIVIPEHYEPVFALKPRARTMLYRDWLVGLAVPVTEYVGELCRKRYDEMESQHPLRG